MTAGGTVETHKSERFRKTYQEQFNVVRHVLLKFPTLRNDLDDLLHDVFLKFFKHMDQIEVGRERPYLIVAARHTAIDQLRKKNVSRTETESFESDEPREALWESDSHHEMRIQALGKILDEIAETKSDGECFRLFYRDGLSLKEIAQRCDVPAATVATRIARLRDRLKKRLRDQIENLS